MNRVTQKNNTNGTREVSRKGRIHRGLGGFPESDGCGLPGSRPCVVEELQAPRQSHAEGVFDAVRGFLRSNSITSVAQKPPSIRNNDSRGSYEDNLLIPYQQKADTVPQERMSQAPDSTITPTTGKRLSVPPQAPTESTVGDDGKEGPQ